jgi:Cu2+-exporting ATPase
MAKAMEQDMRRRFWIAFILSIPIFILSPVGNSFVKISLPDFISVNWLLFILTTPVVFWSGSIFITGTYQSLRKYTLNMSVLISVGVLSAYFFSTLLTVMYGSGETFFEAAALLVTFVLFGHWMEMKSRRGTSESLRALFDLVPPQARVWKNDQEILIPTADLIIGDIVIVKPGDKVAVDGVIIEGETAIDESLVTGESIPVAKKVGDKVIGGSVNQSGSFKFRTTEVGASTVLAQIIKMVEKAQNSKAPGQRLADKAAAWLVVVAVVSGVVTFIGWYFFGEVAAITALTFAISAVVIACPDALGLATPTAVAVGTGIGAKYHILIKDAATLENVSKINTIILDKTGTLTEGKPTVTKVVAVNSFTEEEVLRYEVNLEQDSTHPLSRAIIEEANRRGIKNFEKAQKFETLGGYGLSGIIEGKKILVGTERLLLENGVDLAPIKNIIDNLVNQGVTISLLAVENRVAGVIALSDKIKPTAKQAIADFFVMNIEPVMITGDHDKIAQAVGQELGLRRIFSQVLPSEKASYVKKLQSEGKFVAMVGDGINDAPALAQADIGIAIGSGTDVAIETGSVVLMQSNPYDIVRAIILSKATVRKMKQNLFWAAIYNLLAIPLAAGVFYNIFGIWLRPEISALLMSLSSIIVATNAVLLKRVESKLK